MLYNSLKKIAEDFELLESDGGTNTNVPNASDESDNLAADEAAVINKLDRSVKFDEVDTVTFGLETDDGKIVKVYVNAEQAEAFEKELATKLGEIDDIEEVLNELSKEYEIVDVEWPEEGDDQDSNPEDQEDDGSSSLDQRVYGPKHGKEEVEDIPDRQFQGSESLSYGELVTIELLESTTSLESRFTTPTQLMVYHAIIDLGVPEIALARNANRNEIIKGIKAAAEDMQKNATLKSALKMFIRRASDYEKQAEQNAATEKENNEAHEAPKPESKGVKEEMKIKINEEHADWTFSSDKEYLTISAKGVSITLDSEETEKLIKGINNHSITVVRDESEDPVKKYVFSPRGSSVLVKAVGSPDGTLMLSTDVKELIDTAAPERAPVKESKEKDKETIEGRVEAYGTKGPKSVPWRKTFKNQAEYEKWHDKNEDDISVEGIRKIKSSDDK
jgi:hypothetical protein